MSAEPESPAGGPTPGDTGDAVALALGELGAALLDAGYAVTDVELILRDTAAVHGRSDVSLGVLPSAVLIDDPAAGRTRMVTATGATLTFDQVASVAAIARAAQIGRSELAGVAALLTMVRARPPRFSPGVAVLGSGLMSAGIAVVFRTNLAAVAVAFVLACVVGAVLVFAGRFARVVQLLPFFASFGVSLVVYALATDLRWGTVTLFVVCAPLVILIPGATITTGVLELAAGDVVSGGGRFISGLILWATLALGIVAGAAVIGVSPAAAGGVVAAPLPGWATVPAVVALAVGVGLFFSAAWSMMAVMTGSLLVSYGLVSLAQLFMVAPAASGLAAAVMLPALRLLELFRPQWPASLIFRPSFWLLVPGSLGLVAVSDLTAGGRGDSAPLIGSVVATVVALAVGVQIGALISTLIRPRRRARSQAAPGGLRGRSRGAAR